ncbi:MAG: cyclic nucleotide-binding domain-containing protein [Myxococcales bacterium]|nr:cyclic nucleotide-binding domain-containing protein [Myxococcales bacterium]
MIANLAALRRLPLFRDLTPKELAGLRDYLTWCRFDPGDTLFREGDPAPSCYVLASGDVEVFTRLDDGRKQKLATLGPGALVGHLALIDHKPRSATCQVGMRPARLIELKRADFDRLLYARSPFAYKILDRVALDLVERVRGATARLTDRAEGGDRARSAAEALMGQGSNRVSDGDELDSIEVQVVETAVDQRYRRR